jgi:uncharacterized membrane protein YgaE (UPF0421/DUF939 family)
MTDRRFSLRPLVAWINLEHPIRTALAATLALIVARAFRLNAPYWAPITSLVVTQSTLGAAWKVSRQRFLGTALGAALGALLATKFGQSTAVFGASVLGVGILCAILRLDRVAYRFAGITLAIVMLVVPAHAAWGIALDRFIEVSVGIIAALILTALWPEHKPTTP